MSSQLIYLTTSSYDDPDLSIVSARIQAFLIVDAVLFKQGKFTVSPLPKHFNPNINTYDRDYQQKYSQAILDQCEALIVIKLDGWDRSVEVKGEIEYARHINLPIYYVDEQGQMTSFGGVR